VSSKRGSFANSLRGRAHRAGSDVARFRMARRRESSDVKYGMTPLAALQAGTLNGAELLAGRAHRRVEARLPADVVRCPQSVEIGALEVSFVMKGGVVYRR